LKTYNRQRLVGKRASGGSPHFNAGPEPSLFTAASLPDGLKSGFSFSILGLGLKKLISCVHHQ
jgi:hypothetical protein